MWTSKVLGLGVAFSLLLAACGGAEASPVAEAPAEISSTSTTAPTEAPTETATAEPTEGPEYTAIVIDGQADDWEPYVNIATDRTGNADAGQADMVAIRAFNNDQFFYMAIYLADPSTPAKFSIALHTNSGGDPEYEIWLDTGRNSLVTGIFISGNMARPDGAEMVQGEVIELKLPLSAFGDMQVGSSFIHPDGGDGITYNPQRTSELEPAGGQAALTTSGLIDSDETWSGEVHVSGDITLTEGVTLTIEPGTMVYLASNSDDQQNGREHFDEYISEHDDPVGSAEWDQNAITIDGRGGVLHVVGTADEPIVFQPEGSSTSSAQWDGIYIERGTIQYAKVLYAGRTAIQPLGNLGEEIEIAHNEVRYFHWAGIDSHTQNVWIHHNIVEGGGHQAITAASGNVVEHNIVLNSQSGVTVQANGTLIRNNIFINCVRGVQIGGLTPSGSEVHVVNNTFVLTEDVPEGWEYQGELVYGAFEDGGAIELYNAGVVLTAINNLIAGSFDWGIGLHAAPGAGSVVDYNLIWETAANYQGGSASFAGDNNIFADPMLTLDLAGLTYELAGGSAAVDAGSPEIEDEDGTAADLGAYGGEFAYGW
jgi:hypothetical protein